MTATNRGRRDWWLEKNEEGHREYHITHLVETGSSDDGPMIVMQCAGLPVTGSIWAFGNEIDPWAFCKPYMSVKKLTGPREGHPFTRWTVEQVFSTKPRNRCEDETIEDPLLEPMTISGSFTNAQREATYDKDGLPIMTVSFEQMRGPGLMFDAPNPTVRIGQNVASLGLSTFAQIIEETPLNDAPLWGLPARCVKLSNITWEQKTYGTCDFYYTRTFEFEINYLTFDRYETQQGNKSRDGFWEAGTDPPEWVLTGTMDPDVASSYTQHKDRNKENTTTHYYDHTRAGADASKKGWPYTDPTYPPLRSFIQKYGESNLLVLGIPTSL